MRKKAQISVQINWIFVLIAGAIILLFFIGIVYKQKESSEITLTANVIERLKGILTGAALVTETTNIIQTPDIEITFTCDEDDAAWFAVDWQKGGPTKNLPVEVIFAPDFITGREIITWALNFNAPFSVMNILYVTSLRMRYIFVGNIDDEIYNKIPEEVFKEKIDDITNIQDLNNLKVKFIFFNQEPTTVPASLNNIPNKDVTAIKILGNTIEFYEKDDNLNFVSKGSTFHLNEEMLYGAIFSQDKIAYECNVRKLLKKLSFVVSIYAQKEQSLAEHYGNVGCGFYYADGKISRYKEHVDLCIQQTTTEICTILNNDINDIIYNNGVLENVGNCPLLY